MRQSLLKSDNCASAPGDEPHAWLDLLPLASAALDRHGRIAHANKAFGALVETTGCGEGRLIADLLATDDRAAFQALLAATVSQPDSPRQLECALALADGRSRFVMASLAALGAKPAARGEVLLQLTDITALKVREADLVERESRWDNALVGSSSGVWDQRLDTGKMYYSDMWRQIRGLGPGEEPPDEKTWVELLHPDDRERVLHAIERQNAGDPAFMTFDYRERHKQGHWMWIECRGACVEWNAAGQPVRIVGTDTDITERKASEQALSQMSRRLKLALDVSRIGVFEADFTAGTADWDAGMRTIFGIKDSADIVIGSQWESMLHPDDAERVLKKVEHHVENLLPFSDEYRVLLKDGTTHYIRSRTLPFIDSDGHLKMIGANWDVTADIALHKELERAKTLAEARSDDLERAKQRIEHIALHDHLTELPNRRYLDDLLEQLAGEDRRGSNGLAILHIDLDRFKQINDTLGHNAGDAMLRHASKILRDNVREGDFVARIGGDEFVFVARFDGSRQQVSALAERLISQLRKPVPYEGQDCRFGASIGIACDAKGRIHPRQLLLNADIALYHAKNSGRGRYAYFSLDRHDRMKDSRRLADDLLRGLEQDEFLPFYQFQFDANTLDIVGAETLARWNHPERGILAPGSFLATADEIGAVAEIDGVILEKAIADLDRWKALGVQIPKLSVNVSSRRLHDPALKQKLSALPLPTGIISFELLESIFLDENDEQAMDNLRYLRKLGVDLEIDDFGTGHASIVSLLRLNPKTLKIDRELVQKVADSRSRRSLVGSIIDIGRSLGIRVVAEGVETAGHVRVLRALGCDVLQGFGLAMPMAFDDTIDFIERQAWRRADLPS